MRRYAKSSLAVAVLLVCPPLWAQEVYHSPTPDVFVRLSYDSSPAVQSEGLRHACIAISRNGDYRIERFVNPDQKQRLQGKMPEKQFKQLRALLSDSDFRHVVGSHAGVMRQGAESFGAEIIRDDGTQRLQWLNGDDRENPFPSSVARVLKWLKHFEPSDATPFEYAEFPDVCPTGGLRPLQPAVAANVHP